MCPQLLEVFLLFCTKEQTLGQPAERWIQFLVTTDYQGCTVPFSELFTVLKQTVIDSLVLRIQLSHHLFILWFRSLFFPVGRQHQWVRMCIWSLLTHPFSVSPKRQQQMEFPDDPCKQSWWGADNKGSPCWISQTQCVCFTVCVCACMSVSVKQPGGPKGSSNCVPKTEWRPLKSQSSLLVLSLLPFMAARPWCFTGLTWAGNINSSLFRASVVSSFYFIFLLRPQIGKTVTEKCLLRLNDCNFNSLTSSQWEYLEQCITISVGS